MSDIPIAIALLFVVVAGCILAWVLLQGSPYSSVADVKPKDPWEQVNRKSGSWKEYERPNYPKPPPPAPPRPRTVSPSKPEGWK